MGTILILMGILIVVILVRAVFCDMGVIIVFTTGITIDISMGPSSVMVMGNIVIMLDII